MVIHGPPTGHLDSSRTPEPTQTPVKQSERDGIREICTVDGGLYYCDN